jgi:hypothetical protein
MEIWDILVDRRGTAVPWLSPTPIMQAETNKLFFLRARLLNAQWSLGFGHEKRIIKPTLHWIERDDEDEGK